MPTVLCSHNLHGAGQLPPAQGTEHLWAGDHPSACPQGQCLCYNTGSQRSPLIILLNMSPMYLLVAKSQQHRVVLPFWLGHSQFQTSWIFHLD